MNLVLYILGLFLVALVTLAQGYKVGCVVGFRWASMQYGGYETKGAGIVEQESKAFCDREARE